MCQFFSGIVLRNGDLIWSPYTDSHEDLVALGKLRDTREGNFARVEFCPSKPEELSNVESYHLDIYEMRCPDWFEKSKQEIVASRMRGLVKDMILGGDATILLGGCYIIPRGVTVGTAKASRIIVLSGGTVQVVENGGTVQVV
jgi:hypothetical protein